MDIQLFKDIQSSANKGDAINQCLLGIEYLEGNAFIIKNSEEAKKWITKSAEQGNAEAQAILADIYLGEHEEDANYAESAEWLLLAAQQGLPNAQYLIGEYYYYGKGLLKNEYQAQKWYLKAAEQGYANAQYKLAALYYTHEEFKDHCEEAFEWALLAAKQGLAPAQFILGLMYSEGEVGVQGNHSQARKWLSKSAQQGHIEAQEFLEELSNE